MVLFTAKDLFLSMYIWVCIQSSYQAAISNNANNICVDNCSNHGDCRVVKSVTFCECHLGWGGSTCEVPCDRPCLHGMCVFAGHKQMCLCSAGYRGDLCAEMGYDMGALLNLAKLFTANSVNSLPLVLDPSEQVQANIQRGSSSCTGNFVCQNGGHCVNGHMGGYRCQCDETKFTGNFCQYVCPKPCLNDGTCIRLRRSDSKVNIREVLSLPESDAVYRCICLEGFAGERCNRSLKTVAKGNSSGT
ncbi:hypothetical protein BsWGS_19822 [Bradybaena similaris]